RGRARPKNVNGSACLARKGTSAWGGTLLACRSDGVPGEGETMRRIRLLCALAVTGALASPGSAAALQLVPSATARLHTISSGQPGAQWNTGGIGAGGQLSYDSGTGIATLTAGLDVLNWFDPADAGCPTDAGSNCAFNFGPDLTITLEASYAGAVITPLGGSLVSVTL